jgi:hypothetical protein
MQSQNVLLVLLQFGIDLLAVLIANHLLENDLILRNDALIPHSGPALIPYVFAMMAKNPLEMHETFAAQLASVLNVDAHLMVLSSV